MAAAAASGGKDERATCVGLLALVEALRGRLRRSAELAGQAALVADEHPPPGGNPDPAALVALAWVHLEHSGLRKARSCLKQADDVSSVSPDKLIGTMAGLAAANGALAAGGPAAAAQIIAKARSGWSVPPWLDQQLSLAESRASAAAGDIQASLLVPVLRHEQRPTPVRAPGQAPILVVEPLTEREREVLRHVSGMLNTAEVASEMYISVNTVKTHLKSIYRKLSAAHRAEAVRRARQLQLI